MIGEIQRGIMSQDVTLSALGIAYGGGLHGSYTIGESKKVSCVIVTGFSIEREEERSMKLSELRPGQLEVYVHQVTEYREVPLIPRYVEHYLTKSCSLENIGFVVVTYDSGSETYSYIVPEQEAGTENVRERFTSKPDNKEEVLATFAIPVLYGGGTWSEHYERGLVLNEPENGDAARLVATVSPEYMFSVIKNFIDRGGVVRNGFWDNSFVCLLDREEAGKLFVDYRGPGPRQVIDTAHGQAELVKPAGYQVDPEIKGVVRIIANMSGFPSQVCGVGEAAKREKEKLERAWGRNMPLDAFPSELRASERARELREKEGKPEPPSIRDIIEVLRELKK